MKKFFLIFLGIVFLFLNSCTSQRYSFQRSNLHKQIAIIYIKQGRYSDALRELEIAKRINKNDPEVYNLFGLIYIGEGEYKKAEKNLKKAIKIDPLFSEAYNNLGSLKMLEGDYKLAICFFKKALKIFAK